MATADRILRERIRRNVGHAHVALALHDPGSKASPWIVTPASRVTLPPPGDDIIDVPGLRPTDGRSYVITANVPGATRESFVTPRLGFPFQLRKINITGDVLAADALSFRILISEDNDTSAVAEPTGSDVYEVAGDLIGAEDPGLHAALANGTLILEPWTLVREQGRFLKLKVHNAGAGVRNLTATFDLDVLEPTHA